MKIRTDSIMPLCVIPSMSGNIKSQTISHLGAELGMSQGRERNGVNGKRH